MSEGDLLRKTLADGRVRLTAGKAEFLFERLRPGALLVTISGSDMGQFGTATLDEIRLELMRQQPIELFVDAEAAVAVSVGVSRDWTHFFSQKRDQLQRVSVLVGSRAIELTIAIAQHLSQTGNLIQIYSDRGLFHARVQAARG
ncbi:MAG: hypothetical protein ABIR26_12965 [Ramlibacter sp.]